MNDKNKANAQEVPAAVTAVNDKPITLMAPKPLAAWTFEECAAALANPKLTAIERHPIIQQATLTNAGEIAATVRKAEADVHASFEAAADGVDFVTWLAGQTSRSIVAPICDHPDGKRKLYVTVAVR